MATGKNCEVDYMKAKKILRIAIIIVACLLLIILVVIGIKHFSNSKATRIVKFDGNNISVYDTEDEAIKNAIPDVVAEEKKVEVNSHKYVDVKAKVGIFHSSIVSKTSDNEFKLDFSGIGNEQKVVIEVLIGGDGSFSANALSNEVKKYYFAVIIKNENSNVSSNVSTPNTGKVPTSEITIGDESFNTYSSEDEAYNAASETISKELAENFTVKAISHSEDTRRIWVQVISADGNKSGNKPQIVLSSENDWTNTLDILEFSGQKIVIQIQSEDDMALNIGFRYMSFIIP